jgi:hypothetical protein
MNLLLDTGILGQLCHPNRGENQPVVQWLESLLISRNDVIFFFPRLPTTNYVVNFCI